MSFNGTRPYGREHMPLYPRGFTVLRLLQLGASVIIVGCTAYNLAQILEEITLTTTSVLMAAGVISFVASSLIIVAQYFVHGLYNLWAVLAAEILNFALMLAAAVISLRDVAKAWKAEDDGFCVDDTCFEVEYGFLFKVWLSVLTTAGAFAAFASLLWLATLVIHVVASHRHYQAGLRSTRGFSALEKGTVSQSFSPQVNQVFAPIPRPSYPPREGTSSSQHTATLQNQQSYRQSVVPEMHGAITGAMHSATMNSTVQQSDASASSSN